MWLVGWLGSKILVRLGLAWQAPRHQQLTAIPTCRSITPIGPLLNRMQVARRLQFSVFISLRKSWRCLSVVSRLSILVHSTDVARPCFRVQGRCAVATLRYWFEYHDSPSQSCFTPSIRCANSAVPHRSAPSSGSTNHGAFSRR